MSYSHRPAWKPLLVSVQILALAFFAALCPSSLVLGHDIVSQYINSETRGAATDAARDNAVIDAADIVQKFHDWHLRCLSKSQSPAICEIAQVAQVMREQASVTVLTLAIAPDVAAAKKRGETVAPALVLTMLVPLNVALPAGLSISADGKPIAKLAYRNCNQSGCWVQTSLQPTMLSALKKGRSGGAALSLVDGQEIDIRFSLTGLTAALAALEEQIRK